MGKRAAEDLSDEPYDKARWHFEGEFPEELSEEQAYVHTGMFLAWAVHRDLAGDEFSVALQDAIRSRKLTGAAAYARLGGVFTREMLSPEGRAFADAYYDEDFADDYAEVVAKSLASIYHVKDTWAAYARIAKRCDERFEAWSKKYRRPAASGTHTNAKKSPIESRLARLRARAKEPKKHGWVDVGHITDFASLGDASVVAELRAIKDEYGWHAGKVAANGSISPPYGRWVDYACAFLEGGHARLVAMALDPKEHAIELKGLGKHARPGSYACAILRELKSPESVAAVLDIAEKTSAKARAAGGLSEALEALNLLISFGAIGLSAAEESRARDFLHEILSAKKVDDSIVYLAILSLRGCGNAASLDRIARFAGASELGDAVKLATKAIKKRAR